MRWGWRVTGAVRSAELTLAPGVIVSPLSQMNEAARVWGA